MTAISEVPAASTSARSRRLPRLVGFLAAALVVAVGSYLGPTTLTGLSGGNATATDEPRVLVPLPGGAAAPADGAADDGRLPLAERIAFWTARIGEQPSDYLSLTQLAVAWSEQGRLRVDLDAYARATEAVERALAIAPADPSATAVRGSIRFATHDFSGAEADARAALEAMPRDPSALAILGDALLELGRIDEAAAIYERLGSIAGGAALDIRNARLAFVTGDRAGALSLARKALIAASGGGADGAETGDPAVLGFYHFALGEYARLSGDTALAQEQFRAALQLRSADLGALLGQARVHAFSGDLGSAIRSLEAAIAIAPTPEAEALLGDLLMRRAADAARSSTERAADRTAAATAYGTVALTRTLSALAGAVYDRQLVLFDLEHGVGSTVTLDAARAALEIRPDAAGHDLVAWALHRLGRDAEAWPESQAARATGAADARTLFHAGAIAAALGDAASARDFLSRSLALGPALDPLERDEATLLLAALDAPPPPPR